MIGGMNRRIYLRFYGATQSPGGGPVSDLTTEYEQWAKVEDRTGQQFLNEKQGLYRYDTKITFRAYPSRVITSSFLIGYLDDEYRIEALTKKSEGKHFYWEARCSKITNV
jgi:SPP1 family predicted phage head-tail adaptor